MNGPTPRDADHTSAHAAIAAERAPVDEHVCGICGQRLTRITVPLRAGSVLVISCGRCGWHTRRVDGRLVTQEDVKRLRSRDSAPAAGVSRTERAPVDVVDWYDGKPRAEPSSTADGSP